MIPTWANLLQGLYPSSSWTKESWSLALERLARFNLSSAQAEAVVKQYRVDHRYHDPVLKDLETRFAEARSPVKRQWAPGPVRFVDYCRRRMACPATWPDVEVIDAYYRDMREACVEAAKRIPTYLWSLMRNDLCVVGMDFEEAWGRANEVYPEYSRPYEKPRGRVNVNIRSLE
jgi:hypothetical protein